MGDLKEEVLKMREEVVEIEKQEHSFAKEILSDYKKQNKRLFIILIIVLIMWFATIGYLVYIMNDIGVETTTQEITDFDTINGNITNKGDVYGQDKTNLQG